MNELRFQWDEWKNRANQRKHKLSFRKASEVFSDPFHVSVQDRIVDGEERWQTFGIVDGTLLVIVAHTFQDDTAREVVVRIISARAATRRERQFYEDENG